MTLLALLLAPSGMLGGHAAMAMPDHGSPKAMSHCDEQQQGQKNHPRQSMIDCALACSAMPSANPSVTPPILFAASQFHASPPLETGSTRPEAATPPPRAV